MNTIYHRDGSVTIWNVYTQQWERTSHPSDRVLASHEGCERVKIMSHVWPGVFTKAKKTTRHIGVKGGA